MALTPGARLGPYEVVSAIGVGGMGEVFRATDTNLKRAVAIKVLPDTFAADRERVARFQREAEVLASLNHPNIAAIYGLERSDGLTALVMELVEGEDLSKRITRGAIPVDEALPIARQIAEALEAAHELGIIHRDLKPANVKIRQDGTVKVLDFGLAKAMEPAAAARDISHSPTITSPAMTEAGVILGTAAYMSPEQARGKPMDKRADIWAFGCVLYEMLTGTRAFAGETMTDVLAAVVKSEPDWSALPPDTPRSMRRLLRRCLRKDPAARLRDVGDARIEIQEAMAEPEVYAAAPERLGARWTPAVPWTIAALLAAALAVAATGALRAPSSLRPVIRLELVLPVGVEPYIGPGALAFSPDGTQLAFVGVLAGLRQVYVRRLDRLDAVPVPGTESVSTVFFSPDGRSLGILDLKHVLAKVSLVDGLAVPLAKDADYLSGAAWAADNRITYVSSGALWQVAAEGSATPTQLTTLDTGRGERQHAHPTVVDGGRSILFTVVTGSGRGAWHIEALSLATKERRPVVESAAAPIYAASGHLIFFRDRTLLVAPFDTERLTLTGPTVKVLDEVNVSYGGWPMAAVSSSGAIAYMGGEAASQLVWVSRQGVERATSGTARPYSFPRLEPPDNRRILVSVAGDLYLQETERRTEFKLTRDTTMGNSFPVWTPNGKTIVFRSSTGLRRLGADGSTPSQVIPGTSARDYPNAVSPDGTTLLFGRLGGEESSDIYALSLDGESNPRPLVSTTAFEGGGQFSPDGKWIAYASGEGRGQYQILLRPFPGPDRKLIVAQSGKYPRWTKGGAEIVYRDGNKMMAVDVSWPTSEPRFSSPRLLFEQRYEFSTGQTSANYDVTPDGERFVMVKSEPGSSRLNVVLNWNEELKRLVPGP